MFLSRFLLDESTRVRASYIPALREDPNLAELFLSDGFAYFLKDARPITARIAEFLPHYMAQVGLAAESVDCVLLVTDSIGFDPVTETSHSPMIALRDAFYETLAMAGMVQVCPQIVGGAGCANLAYAIDFVRGRFSQYQDSTALVLFADSFVDDNKRIMPLLKTRRTAAGTIGSDLVAACVLTSEAPNGERAIEIKGTHKGNHLPMVAAYASMARTGDCTPYVLETVKGLSHFKRQVQVALGKPLSAFKDVYVGNYTADYFKIYNMQFGWVAGQIDMSTKQQFAHLQSLDGLAAAWNSRHDVDDGLIFLIGPAMWAAISFSSRQDEKVNGSVV